MSAFNNAAFNHSLFNITKKTGPVWLEGKSEIPFTFSFAGTDLYFHGGTSIYFESNEPRVDKGRIPIGYSSEEFSADTNVIGLINAVGSSIENIESDSNNNLSQIVNLNSDAEETFDASANVSQEVYDPVSFIEEIGTSKMSLGQIVRESADVGEVFNAAADVIALAEWVCEFPDLILKPGQALIIDSGSYNVMLDGNNAIHLQKGDWIDNLNRNTQNVTISGTNANKLSATIIYTDRYL